MPTSGCASTQVVKGDENEHDIMADLVASQEAGGEGRKLLGLKKLKKKLKKEFNKWKGKINSVEKKFKEASKKLKKALDDVKDLKSDVSILAVATSTASQQMLGQILTASTAICHLPVNNHTAGHCLWYSHAGLQGHWQDHRVRWEDCRSDRTGGKEGSRSG